MGRLARQDWLNEGYAILKESGEAGLTIDGLAKRLKKTKGSFYHHFKSRDDFLLSLLSHWEESQTLEIIASSRREQGFEAMNEKLLALSAKAYAPEAEVAIRAWALRDPMARAYQKRVDEKRVALLQQMFAYVADDRKKIEMISLIRYCLYIGSQQIIPALDQKTYTSLLGFISELFERDLSINNEVEK